MARPMKIQTFWSGIAVEGADVTATVVTAIMEVKMRVANMVNEAVLVA